MEIKKNKWIVLLKKYDGCQISCFRLLNSEYKNLSYVIFTDSSLSESVLTYKSNVICCTYINKALRTLHKQFTHDTATPNTYAANMCLNTVRVLLISAVLL